MCFFGALCALRRGEAMLNLLKFIYVLPGRIMLWWTYQNPTGGISGVAKSGRNYRSPTFTFLTATGFWFMCAFFVVESDFEFVSAPSVASGPLVKPGSAHSSGASSTRASTPNTSADSIGSDTACEKAKKTAGKAKSLDELELARAKVEALC